MKTALLSAQALEYRYPGGVLALRDLHLHIQRGRKLAILGANGSGKTTLLLHLNGAFRPHSGSIYIEGQPARYDRHALLQWRRRVGLVLQEPEDQLFAATVEQDISFGPLNLGLSAAQTRERVAAALHAMRITPLAQRPTHSLSFGQKKRVAIAGILAMRPKYLVLDEPMAGLDPRGRAEILSLIESLRERNHTGIVMVSHSMDDVAMYADRIAVLNNGTLAMIDTPEAVFSRSEELLNMGLNLPQATRLVRALRERGVVIERDYYRMDELKQELIGRWKHVR